MIAVIRPMLFAICAIQLVFAIAFFAQVPAAIALWPFPGTTPLTYIFVASIFAAAAASTFWATTSGHYGALVGVFVDYVAILTPFSVLAIRLSAEIPAFTMAAVICPLAVLFGLGMIVWALRFPLEPPPPMPSLVWWSFVGFVVALIFFGLRLILREPNIIPWTITPDLSTLIGWIFVGAAVYFAYGIARPSWWNAGGQLAGFLAYDVVLIVPFLTRLSTVPPEFRTGLYLYTAVVVYSGLLAAYYLFVHPQTRVWKAAVAAPRPEPTT